MAVDGRGRDLLPAFLDVFLDQGLVDCVQSGAREFRVFEEAVQLFLVEGDGPGFLRAANGDGLHKPFGEPLECRNRRLLDDSDLALGERCLVRSLHLFSDTFVRLLRTPANGLTIPGKLVPPEFAFLLLIDCHGEA